MMDEESLGLWLDDTYVASYLYQNNNLLLTKATWCCCSGPNTSIQLVTNLQRCYLLYSIFVPPLKSVLKINVVKLARLQPPT